MAGRVHYNDKQHKAGRIRALQYYYKNRDVCVARAITWQLVITSCAKRLLGGDPPRCLRCGFADERVLHIDHIGGGGGKERLVKSAYQIRYWIVKHPDEAKLRYQLLCANCNYLKAIEAKEYKRKS